MYGSTIERGIVQMLMPNRTYKRQPWSGAFNTLHIVAIHPAAVVAATNFNLGAGR